MTQLPVRPVNAATVILTRPASQGRHPWECFMIRRPVGSDFAANVYVFPGGKVDPADTDPELAEVCRGHPGIEIDTREEQAAWRALRVAAIRELFEEAGVLVAEREDVVIRLDGAEAARFRDVRAEVYAGDLSMLALARRERLTFPLDRFHAIARWITPESFPRRFDTLFFVSELPDGQEPQPHFRETTEGLWIAPALALERYRAGSFPLVFATEKNLEQLAAHGSVEGLIASASSASLAPVMPTMLVEDGVTRFLIPGDEGYQTA